MRDIDFSEVPRFRQGFRGDFGVAVVFLGFIGHEVGVTAG